MKAIINRTTYQADSKKELKALIDGLQLHDEMRLQNRFGQWIFVNKCTGGFQAFTLSERIATRCNSDTLVKRLAKEII